MDAISAAYQRLREVDDPAIVISMLDEADACERASRVPADAPLAGVPFLVKDNIDVAGLPTTAACPSFAYVPDRSAFVVERLEAAGAVAIGKTNLDQFATGLVGTRSPYGTPRSPIDPALIPGGSSSGSAVAVAHGIVPFALGTDTAGSGRVPASLCGVVGLKPTRGWLSTAGVVPAVRSLDCVSVFARSVEFASRVTAIAGEFDDDDPMSRERPSLIGRAPSLRVASADELDLEPFLAAGRLLYEGPWVAERYAAFGDFIAVAPDADASVKAITFAAADWTAAQRADAEFELARLRRIVDRTWRDYDAIVLPTVPRHPSLAEVADDPIGVNRELGQLSTFCNVLDLCAVALPDNRTVLAPAWRDDVAAAVAADLNGESWRPARGDDAVNVAVAGAHLRGQPLHHQLTELGARLVAATTTAPAYRLFALANTTPPKPGLVRVAEGGAPIEVEVYELDAAGFGRFVVAIPPPLGIGSVDLANGQSVKGFICEPAGLDGAEDITRFGGWRAYVER